MTKKNEAQEPKSYPTGEELVPLEELTTVDISEDNVERMARGFILGTQAIGRKEDVRQKLEDKVIKKVGRKGKLLVDKLFELVEGIYIIDKRRGGKDGKDEVRYYEQPPNLAAITYALDRVLGKPATKGPVGGEKKGIEIVESLIKNLSKGTIEHKKSIRIESIESEE